MRSPDDVKYIRITDFDDDGIPPGHEFVTAEAIEDDARLQHDDVLFARSGATAGKTFIYSKDIGPAVFAGYCIRFQFDSHRMLPKFVYYYTKTTRYLAWVRSIQRPAGQPNINKEEFKSFTIPVPVVDIQVKLVAELEAARAGWQQKVAEADGLLAGLDTYLLDQLGLTPPPEDNRKVFAVRLGQLRGKRIDAPAYQPFYAKGHPPKTPPKPLSEIADIDRNTAPKPAAETELVPYIGLPECELTEVREVVMRPYSEARGRSVVKQGDILFARIEPSVFNKKYVLADDLKGHNYAYTSTEFYVVRAKQNEVLQEYLYALFFCSFVFAQVKGKTTGSSGRRRIDPDLFSLLQIPVPDQDLQKTIAAEVSHRRAEARRLRLEAAAQWAAAKQRFEKQLLGA